MLTRQPYRGLVRKLVLAFDVGTTYSGVSYAILDPGEVPKTLGVNRWSTFIHIRDFFARVDEVSDTQLKSMWAETARFHLSSTMTSREGPEPLVRRRCKSISLNKQRMSNGSSLNGMQVT